MQYIRIIKEVEESLIPISKYRIERVENDIYFIPINIDSIDFRSFHISLPHQNAARHEMDDIAEWFDTETNPHYKNIYIIDMTKGGYS